MGQPSWKGDKCIMDRTRGDFILTNEEGMVSQLTYRTSVGKSHRFIRTFTIRTLPHLNPDFHMGIDYPSMAGISW